MFLFLTANFGAARCVRSKRFKCHHDDCPLPNYSKKHFNFYVDLNEQDKEGHTAVEHMVVRRCDFDDVLKAVHLFSKCDGKVDVSRVETLALQNGCSNVARYCGWIGAEGREEQWNAYADLRFAYGAYPCTSLVARKATLLTSKSWSKRAAKASTR